jgi:hypothetical protein
VQSAKKQGTPTIHGIAKELEKQTSTPVDVEQLKEDLQEAQKIGLVEITLVNNDDKPTLAWRSLLPRHNRLNSLPIVS